jgi:hypothetical protein
VREARRQLLTVEAFAQPRRLLLQVPRELQAAPLIGNQPDLKLESPLQEETAPAVAEGVGLRI